MDVLDFCSRYRSGGLLFSSLVPWPLDSLGDEFFGRKVGLNRSLTGRDRVPRDHLPLFVKGPLPFCKSRNSVGVIRLWPKTLSSRTGIPNVRPTCVVRVRDTPRSLRSMSLGRGKEVPWQNSRGFISIDQWTHDTTFRVPSWVSHVIVSDSPYTFPTKHSWWLSKRACYRKFNFILELFSVERKDSEGMDVCESSPYLESGNRRPIKTMMTTKILRLQCSERSYPTS